MTGLEFRPCLLPRRRRCLFDMASCVFMECVEKEEGDGFWAQRRKKRVKKERGWRGCVGQRRQVLRQGISTTSGLLIRGSSARVSSALRLISKRGKGWWTRFLFAARQPWVSRRCREPESPFFNSKNEYVNNTR